MTLFDYWEGSFDDWLMVILLAIFGLGVFTLIVTFLVDFAGLGK